MGCETLLGKRNVGPFLNWAGGKRWFVQRYPYLFPSKFNRYIEPFLGAGSVFFHLRPADALVGDINPELVAAYSGIRTSWREVLSSLRYRQRAHDKDPDYFYRLRARLPSNLVQRASRMIYLNRTCFNGIYRVNHAGMFNVPRGSKNKVLWESDDFEHLSELLKPIDIVVDDFEGLILQARLGDFIYADPPYTVSHNMNGFVKYNELLFSWADQERLARALNVAKKRGAIILASNANHCRVRDLYGELGFYLMAVSRFSRISGDSKSRRAYEEVVISSIPLEGLLGRG